MTPATYQSVASQVLFEFSGVFVMKLKQSACLSLLAGVVVGVSAQAGTITFSGTAKQATCSSNVNGGGTNGSITWGTVDVADFPSAGARYNKPPVMITISLTGCAPGVSVYNNFYHTTSATVDTGDSFNIKTLTGSSMLAVMLLRSDAASPLSPKASLPASPSRHPGDPVVYTNSSGAATLTYYAQLRRRSGAIQPGAFSTNVGYVIAYD